MPIRAISQVATARNGLGAFIVPCKRVTLTYCNWGGSSQGMRDFLTKDLKAIAAKHPQIEFKVMKKEGHPIIKGEYNNGKEKVISVRKRDPLWINDKIYLLTQQSGKKLIKNFGKKQDVESQNESIRGIWSPMHTDPSVRHRV
ncbi:hypothetical protein BABINDRAFT_10255 [Babjeviella inositovora NRRL Y-12698]|uniref:Large ribosomal subunit protein mL43 n=1 Tax=Babjeviella inositovora NRRL Y-12698 TaxID=984486 RepID=A0A1E3QIC6_9ASCO|nr:uncharacterized protein BABINDRAFT_10255 [Babjeviella inositovora NRRL Y-12698]ODQ77358.1 hypothetical protein BABINDRAFT_10255 [Babjeviella inositovora NRRL Y-12698]